MPLAQPRHRGFQPAPSRPTDHVPDEEHPHGVEDPILDIASASEWLDSHLTPKGTVSSALALTRLIDIGLRSMTPGDGKEPIFVFDSHEEFQPVAVESVEALESGERWNAPHKYHSKTRHER